MSFQIFFVFLRQQTMTDMNGIEEINLLSQEAEIVKFTPEELREYEDSLKAYRDIKNSIETAKREGRAEGEAMEKKATIKRLLASGASVDIIAIATELTHDNVKLLIDEISKECYKVGSIVTSSRWPILSYFVDRYNLRCNEPR